MVGLQIAELCLHLMEAAAPMTTSDTRTVQEWASQLSSLAEASKLAVRLHLLTLLFEVKVCDVPLFISLFIGFCSVGVLMLL